MRYHIILAFLFIYGCKTIEVTPRVIQNVKIILVFQGYRIDTFQNKFFFGDTSNVDMWFTQHEQDTILHIANSFHFFTLPQIIPEELDGITYRPYPYPAYLRIMSSDGDNTVAFYRKTTVNYKNNLSNLHRLSNFILDKAMNKWEYKEYYKPKPYFYFDYFDDL